MADFGNSRKYLWLAVAEKIEQSIRDREFAPGDKLPTEAEFSKRFMVNRHTLRRALAHLQERGLVESTQGRGSYVRRPALQYTIGRRTRFSDIVRGQEMTASTRTITTRIDKQPPHAVMDALGLARGEWAIVLKRIGYANAEPIGLSTHHFPYDRFPMFLDVYKQHLSVTKTLMHCGVLDFTRRRTVVAARLPTTEESDRLNVPKHVPMIVTRTWNADPLGNPLEYGEGALASDRVEIDIVDDRVPTPDHPPEPS